MGDTMRSWRLRERLSAKEQFSPAEVLDIHYDSVNPARRDIGRVGLHLRKTQPEALSDGSVKALAALEPWLAGGASSDLKVKEAELATRLSTFFRFVVTPLARKFGGGESGLARFLKDATLRINKDPNVKRPFTVSRQSYTQWASLHDVCVLRIGRAGAPSHADPS